MIAAGGRTQFRILLPEVVGVDEDDLTFTVSGRAVRPRILGSAQTTGDADEVGASAESDPDGDQR